MLLKEYLIDKEKLESFKGDSIEEKIYNYFIEGAYDHLRDREWDFHDIKETSDKKDYCVVLRIKEDGDIQHTIAEDENGNVLESVSQEVKFSKHGEDCCESCCGCGEKEISCSGCENELEDVSQDIELEQNFSKSIAYNGPWADKEFKMDIAQAAAFFEVVQFMEYLVRKTEMATPIAMRSAQECQRFIVENLCDFDQETILQQENKDEPIKIKLKDEFAEHLKNWQEESIKLFEERVAQTKKKPEIVKATMMPKDGFDLKGPGF